MKTQLPPESLESRIAPAAVSSLGDDFAGPVAAAVATQSPVEAAPPLLIVDEEVMTPRSGNIDLGTVVPDIVTVSPDGIDLTELSESAAAAVARSASTLDVLATSALAGEPSGIGALGVGDGEGAQAGIDVTSALESGSSSIADLVLIPTGGFASANPESLLIVKVQ